MTIMSHDGHCQTKRSSEGLLQLQETASCPGTSTSSSMVTSGAPSHWVVLCCVVLCCVVLCCVVLCCVVLCCVVLCCVVLCCVVLCCVVLCCVVLCCVVLCCVVLCCVVLCCAVLCCVVLWYVLVGYGAHVMPHHGSKCLKERGVQQGQMLGGQQQAICPAPPPSKSLPTTPGAPKKQVPQDTTLLLALCPPPLERHNSRSTFGTPKRRVYRTHNPR